MTASLPQPPESPSSDTEAAAASAESSPAPQQPAKPRAPRAPRATTPRAPRKTPARPKTPAAADAAAAEAAPESPDTPKAPGTPRSPRTAANRATPKTATPRTPAKKPATPRATGASPATARTPAAKKPAATRPTTKKSPTPRASAAAGKDTVDPQLSPTASPELVIPPRPPLPVPPAQTDAVRPSDPTPADVAVEEAAVDKVAEHDLAADEAPDGAGDEVIAVDVSEQPGHPELVTETPLDPEPSGDESAESASTAPAPSSGPDEVTSEPDEGAAEAERSDASSSAVADGTPPDVRVDDVAPVVHSDEIASRPQPPVESDPEPSVEPEPSAGPEPEPSAERAGELAVEAEPVAEPAADDETSAPPAVDLAPSGAPDGGAAVPVLTLRGVTKTFGELRAVDAIDLTVPAGSFYGLVGPNGAGKTTTLSIIAGLLRADGGAVTINGVDAAKRPRETKKMIGVLPDRLRTFDRLTGRQLLSYYGALRGLPAPLVESRVADLARAFDLVDALARPVSDYSAGMTKKVMLAGAMIHSPRLLVLDEPFEAVDPVSSGVILDILGTYVAHGGTVILSSHGMELVERVCSRVAVIVSGQVLAEGTVDEVRGEATLEQRFLELAGGLGDVEGLEWLHTFSA